MKKIFFLFICCFLFILAVPAQNLSVQVNYVTTEGTSNKNKIYYEPDLLLSWDDFKGKPVAGSDAAALTSAGFGVKLDFRRVNNTSQLMIAVNCSFSRKDSWVLPGNKTAYILNHEQKHFDLAYLYTRLFIQKLKTANFTSSNYAALIQNIYNETAEAMSKVQNQYDMESNHSRIPEKQAEWDKKISSQLAIHVKNY